MVAVIGAAILSLIGPKLVNSEQLTWSKWFLLFIFAIFLLLYSFNFLGKFRQKILIAIRDSSYFSPKIGIIYSVAGNKAHGIPLVWTDVAPECWGTLVRDAARKVNQNVKTKRIDVQASFDSFDVIINPYGGNLPELNLVDFPVYKKLLDYIKRGGFFVNIADIPTYWAYEPTVNRLVDRTPAVYDVNGRVSRLFSRTPLLEELSLSAMNVGKQEAIQIKLNNRYNDFGKSELSLRVSRCVTIEKHIESVTTPIIFTQTLSNEKKINIEITPLFFCSYGKGLCLISLSWLDREEYNKNKAYGDYLDYGICNRDLKKLIPYLIVKKIFKEHNKANSADAKSSAAD
ncbi:MAG: hypothetical protein K8S56_00400 [Candidatus Cloacimonetes bacterium]|nr:hypothetical protein [Candidatus Cloacimonadota bacterium]